MDLEAVKIIGYLPAWDVEIDKKNWEFKDRQTFSGTNAKFKNLSNFRPPAIWSHPDPTYVQEYGKKHCYQVEFTMRIIKKIEPPKGE